MRPLPAWISTASLVLGCGGVPAPRVVDAEPVPATVFAEAEPAPSDTIEATVPRHTVELGKPAIQGDIDRAALLRFVERERERLARCAARGEGSVDVRYLIGDHGELLGAKLDSSTAPDSAKRCVIAAIERWDRLPKPTCSIVVVTQRITLRTNY